MAQARFGQPRFSPLRTPLAFGEQKELTASPMQAGAAQWKAAAPPAPIGPNIPMPGLKQKKRKGLGAFYGQ